MKSRSFTPASLFSILRQPVFSIRPNPGRSITYSAVPPQPLYLRPPVFQASLTDLTKWHDWARNEVTTVGSTLFYLDDGPDPTLLHKELKWLIEDALQHPFMLTPWNNSDDAVITPVPLRACLDDLYQMWKQRIEERRALPYILGCEHWRDLILRVEEGVFIPRPQTEMIVDLVDDAVRRNGDLRDGVWADLGTGSGALAIGIAEILGPTGGRLVATDLSPVAVAVASSNVQTYQMQERIEVRQGSWFDPLKKVEKELSGLVSNPPYIPSEDIDGGPNGMNDLIHLCNGAASMLKPGGFFALETNGETQSKLLVDYMDKKVRGCFHNINIVSDLAGIQRFVTGYRASD